VRWANLKVFVEEELTEPDGENATRGSLPTGRIEIPLVPACATRGPTALRLKGNYWPVS